MFVTAEYSAHHLQVLEGLEAVRKRPGMYIGSTDSRGLMHCLWEIIDNAVDEALAGNGSRIEIVLHPDGSVEVRDRGRGIPVVLVDADVHEVLAGGSEGPEADGTRWRFRRARRISAKGFAHLEAWRVRPATDA